MTEFEPLGTPDELTARLRQDHALNSASNVGERFAAIVCSSSVEEVRRMAESLDKAPADDAAAAIDILANTEEGLSARLEIVRTAIVRLAAVADDKGLGG